MGLRDSLFPHKPALHADYIPARAFGITAGTPAFGEIGTTNVPGWAMDAAAIEKVGAVVGVPANAGLLESLSIDVAVAADPSGGVVVWGAKYALLAPGDDFNEPASPFWNPVATAAGEDILQNVDVGISEVEIGAATRLALYIWRAATNGSDTLAADAFFIGARPVFGIYG